MWPKWNGPKIGIDWITSCSSVIKTSQSPSELEGDLWNWFKTLKRINRKHVLSANWDGTVWGFHGNHDKKLNLLPNIYDFSRSASFLIPYTHKPNKDFSSKRTSKLLPEPLLLYTSGTRNICSIWAKNLHDRPDVKMSSFLTHPETVPCVHY